MQLIEDKVKNIIDKNEYLSVKEKADIICLIECYKSADKMAQEFYRENEKLRNAIEFVVKTLEENNLNQLANIIKNEEV